MPTHTTHRAAAPDFTAFAADVLDFAAAWLADPGPADYTHPITQMGRTAFLAKALGAISMGTEHALEHFAAQYMHLGQS